MKFFNRGTKRTSVLLMGGLGNQLFIIARYHEIQKSNTEVCLNGYWFSDVGARIGEHCQFDIPMENNIWNYWIHRILLKFQVSSFYGFIQGYFQRHYSGDILEKLLVTIQQKMSSTKDLSNQNVAVIHLRLNISPPDFVAIKHWAMLSKQSRFKIIFDSKTYFLRHQQNLVDALPSGSEVDFTRGTPLEDFGFLMNAQASYFSDSTFSWWAWNLRRFCDRDSDLDVVPKSPLRSPPFCDV